MKPDDTLKKNIRKINGNDHKIVTIEGDVLVRDETITIEEFGEMTKEDMECYVKYKEDAEIFREDLYNSLCSLSGVFQRLKRGIERSASERKPMDFKAMAGDAMLLGIANECELLVKVLKNPKDEPQRWDEKNMTRLRDVLLRAEGVFDIRIDGRYWIDTLPIKPLDHNTPTRMLQEMSLLFPAFQYHRHKEKVLAEEREKAKIEEAAKKAEALKAAERAKEEQKEPEKTYKDYWKGLSRDEQLAEISHRFTLIEEYCERMNAVVYQLSRVDDERYPEAAKILEKNIIQKFYFTNIESNKKTKDIKGAADYVLVDDGGSYLRDKRGNVLLDERAMTNSVIRGFFEKFENLSHEFYKLNDLIGDFQLTAAQYTPTV